jgi:AraC-like DNA-binding protein
MWITGCTLLAGGHAHCTRAWTLGPSPLNQCWKLYHVVEGSGRVAFEAGEQTLVPGYIYFLNGYRQVGQACEQSMVVDWLHFQVASWRLRLRLDHLPPCASLACEPRSWRARSLAEVRALFDQPARVYQDLRNLRADAAPATQLRVLGLVLGMLGELLENHPESAATPPEVPPPLQSALDFMERHYLDNPPLATLAHVAGWQVEHFHRRFRQVLGLTPLAFMERRRLEEAVQLLSDKRLTIKEVALQLRFSSQFYFTRVFTRRFGVSPTKFRSDSSGSQPVGWRRVLLAVPDVRPGRSSGGSPSEAPAHAEILQPRLRPVRRPSTAPALP